MGKSKLPKKIIGIGSTVAIAGVLLYLFVLPIILVTPNIAPQQQFEIPINEPIPVGLPEINPEAIICEEDSIDPDCNEGIETPVDELPITLCTDEIPTTCVDDSIPPITSEDPPIEQIIDEIPEEDPIQIILPDPETIENTVRLFGKVTKTDNDLVSTVIETTFDIPLQSIFVESDTNKNFDSGSLVIEILGNTSATNLSLVGTAELDILIGNETIFTQSIPVSLSKLQGSGEIIGEFVSISGQKSNEFLFLFNDHLNKFPTQGSTELEINLNNIEITIDSRETFGSSELNLLTMTIDTDPDLILITDEEGIISRVFPKDTGFSYHNTGKFALKSGGGCGSYWTRHSGTIEIFDSENISLQSGILKIGDTYGSNCGRNYNILSLTLERDQTYRLVHTGDTQANANFDITFKTPKSQKNYAFQCYYGNNAPLVWHTCTYPNPDATEVLHAPPPTS